MAKVKKIKVKGLPISIKRIDNSDYISLTDIAKYRESQHTDDVIRNWLRNRNTIELLGMWESIHNPEFNPVEFDGIRSQAGLNSFVLTPKRWIERTKAKGIISKPGRYGGTFAHQDIAFEFASWVSVEFKLFIIKEYQRLKSEENNRLQLDWNLQRTLSKINYTIHTDAIKENLIPIRLSTKHTSSIYASEADLLNMALFGITASEWRKTSPKSKGNIRDNATLEQLVVLSNLESINAVLIRQGLPQADRLAQLNSIAITQMTSLVNNVNLKKLR